jgi:Dolichyl-phosphate-mannose-protein mannosyltransferase
MRLSARVYASDSALRSPTKTFGGARRSYDLTALVIALSVLGLAARLILINQPFIDRWSWRQSDVAAIARNFCENGFRFAYPQINWAGRAPSYVGTEFPILPFLAAICYKFAGVHEWIGRSESVIFFALSLPFFFLLVRDTWHGLPAYNPSAGCRCHVAATWATFFYSFAPLNVFAGRSFMPDVPSLSLAIIGSYFFLRWIDRGKSTAFFLAAITLTLSFLIKITSIVIAVPLAYILVGRLCQTPGVSQNGVGGSRSTWTGRPPGRASGSERVKRPTIYRAIALFAAITLLPSVAWYWHAYQIAERFYPHHFFGEGGIRIENFSWYWGIARRTATLSLTPILSIMAPIGLFVAPRAKHSRFFHWWLAGMILFIIAVGYGNRHPWYQLPLVPIAAAFAGAACAFLGSRISFWRVATATLSILLVGSFAGLAYAYVRWLYEPSATQLRDAGLELKKITASNALIVAADTGDPTIFYYAERKGWHFLEIDAIYNGNPADSQQAIVGLEQLRHQGATHLVFTTNTFWWLEYYPEFTRHLSETTELMEANREFRIYKLNPVAE